MVVVMGWFILPRSKVRWMRAYHTCLRVPSSYDKVVVVDCLRLRGEKLLDCARQSAVSRIMDQAAMFEMISLMV